jgi:hypothetical protein
MLWQWFLVVLSDSDRRWIRVIAVTAGLAVVLYVRDAHGLSNYYVFPIYTGVYLVIRISLWVAMVAVILQRQSRAVQRTFPKT